jgi:hypothetical protein
LSDFNGTHILSTDFQKNVQIPNFMKIHCMRCELFQADRQTKGLTDMTKLITAFCNFADVLKNSSSTQIYVHSIHIIEEPGGNHKCMFQEDITLLLQMFWAKIIKTHIKSRKTQIQGNRIEQYEHMGSGLLIEPDAPRP